MGALFNSGLSGRLFCDFVELRLAKRDGGPGRASTPPRMNKLFYHLTALLGTGALTFSSAFGELPKFNNVTVTVVGDAGQNMESLNKYADDFTKAGITIKQVGATFTGLYDKLKTDFVAGSGDYDMVIFYPSYIGDFAGNGYLEPLDDLMNEKLYRRSSTRNRGGG
jgi:ABC-type glycerol-3-phosphate transport system substrate-binding protein